MMFSMIERIAPALFSQVDPSFAEGETFCRFIWKVKT